MACPYAIYFPGAAHPCASARTGRIAHSVAGFMSYASARCPVVHEPTGDMWTGDRWIRPDGSERSRDVDYHDSDATTPQQGD